MYKSVFKKILFQLYPETAHDLAYAYSKVSPDFLFGKITTVKNKCLESKLGSTLFENPVGLAGGFDKNAELIGFMRALGFGFLEIGSITHDPVEGNEKPRVFRLTKDHSMINRMGLPNDGVQVIAKRLQKKQAIPLGLNIAKSPKAAKNKEEGIHQIAETFRLLHQLGQYITFNLSCPNTSDGKTFESPENLKSLLTAIDGVRKSEKTKLPLLVKFSPDTTFDEFKKLVELCLDFEMDGFVISNTTTARDHLPNTSGKLVSQIGRGGLSGRALKMKSDEKLAQLSKILGNNHNKEIMGVGGIMNFDDLKDKLALGARHFQVYTGLIYEGPFFVKSLNLGLVKLCKELGVKNYQELSGQREISSIKIKHTK